MGVGFVIVGMLPSVLSGLLPPCLLFAYTTYLLYGALTNNPDPQCNTMAAAESQNRASIIAGLAFSIASVTYAAYSSARSVARAFALPDAEPQPASSSSAPGPSVIELGAAGIGIGAPKTLDATGKAVAQGHAIIAPSTTSTSASSSPGAYADAPLNRASASASGSSATAPNVDYAGSGQQTSGAACCGSAGDGSGSGGPSDAVEPRPWLFHLTMMFGGLYLAMLLTNWGDPATTDPKGEPTNGNPELSLASMWVRIVTQWLVYLIFGWTLIAPACCPNRDFTARPARQQVQ